MEKKPFLTESMAQDIIQDVPTPFHVYDEKGIRENARRINKAFSWNKGFREYFAVKALPNPVILQILKEDCCKGCYGCCKGWQGRRAAPRLHRQR